MAGILVGGAGIALGWGKLSFLLMPHIPLAVAVVTAMIPRSVIVGDDGVYLGGIRSRFIPFREVDEVEQVTVGVDTWFRMPFFWRERPAVKLTLKSGKTITLGAYRRSGAHFHGLCAAIGERLGNEREAHEALDEMLARGSRTPQEWAAAILGLVRPDYRSPGISEASLLSTLSDGSADETARVAAAAVLRTSAQGSTSQIRDAAERTASPRVRIALEELCEEEIEVAAVRETLRRAG